MPTTWTLVSMNEVSFHDAPSSHDHLCREVHVEWEGGRRIKSEGEGGDGGREKRMQERVGEGGWEKGKGGGGGEGRM